MIVSIRRHQHSGGLLEQWRNHQRAPKQNDKQPNLTSNHAEW